ncbi:hypothetical protein LTR37_019412 [Vermiconidia calcicola]|uniref:Uncharacterized protein n=1 Tax=Vermiconidia calcicola TaxID=1690605 RepID=A0ACC3MG28_9PEZI|nr:hypothetical protein LTR37_019412 [Vermiconidia calcicola]
MARSPSDATRFTATGPYASSGTGFASNPTATASPGSQISFGTPAPDGETPQQKIARLRAAAALAKQGKESQFDKVVRVGRVWADRAHRATAFGLIGLTVVSGMVAVAGISDMMLHNRRRRNEWLAGQQAKTAIDLAEAKAAQAEGRVTEDQILLINRERAAAEAQEAKRNRPGMFKRARNYLFSGLSSEEQKGGKLGAGASAAAASQVPREEILGEKEDRGVLKAVEEKVEANRRSGERVEEILRPVGGPLDRQAERVASAIAGTSQTWSSWITGR